MTSLFFMNKVNENFMAHFKLKGVLHFYSKIFYSASKNDQCALQVN